MNLTKKLITTLVAGATLGLAAPVFADTWHHDRGYDHRDRYSHYDHRDFRGHDRRVVVVQRPYVVNRPYVVAQPYYEPAPQMGLGAMIGAAIGTIIENQHNR